MTTTELPAYDHATGRRPVAVPLTVGIAAAVIALGVPLATVVALGTTPYDAIFRGYPGLEISVLSTGLRVVVELASMLTIGSLVALLFLLARPRPSRLPLAAEPEWRIARISSLVWALTATVLVAVDAADANGQPLARLLEPGGLGFLVEAAYLPQAWIITAAAGFLAFGVIAFASRWRTLLIALWASAIALLAPIVVGQILVGPGHDFGSDAGVLLAVSGTVAYGVAVVLAIRRATGRLLRPETLGRAGAVLAVAFPLIIASELVLAGFKLVGGEFAATPTGLLIALRLAVDVVAGGIAAACAVAWRRGRLTDRRIGRALAAGAVLASAFVALTVVMTRIPPPQYFVPTSISQVFLGFELPDAPSFATLVGGWRLNILFAVIATAGITVYLVALRSARGKGVRWPLGRTISWVLGWIVVVVATSSGFGMYSGSDFGVHMIVHMGLNMLAPVLLSLGGVVTLLLRATTPRRAPAADGMHEWIVRVMHWPLLRVLTNPLVVFVLFIGSYYGLYFSSIFEDAVRYHWAHQLMNLHFLIVGYLFYWLVIGVDRPPRPLPPLGKLGLVLAAMPFHAFFGIALMTATTPIAENYYLSLDQPWADDLMASQYLGGGVAWAGGELPLLIVVIALGIQWARQDQREATRTDRHLDRGLDDEFDAYNDMLAKLAERRGAAGVGSAPGGER
ncbi:cytochrome c oxidase assembly protein [Homoserinibacter sp. GY 40078]|uniref:cytochrome c oxidase assembly protein n=1 Tax=Homoserinibacter sp. GY 40078 TaxID=2603275 RepID=UPI0011C74EC7|nr:cytochrome c oxidase assembly protein [Homoserinibacter sp. GY 40078]TXK18966.1 cytochrome c oxidase assembly protein [Homoserinibacter sp. GY 40078]